MATHANSNMHWNRVHTQFWADLNNRVDITKIENEVWAKMRNNMEQGRNDATSVTPRAASAVLRHTTTMTARAGSRIDCDSVMPSSKDSSRLDIASCSKEAAAAADESTSAVSAADETASSASPTKAFAGVLGYEELGHVPTLDEFRSEWSKLRSQPDVALPNSSRGSRWRHQGQQGGGQAQQQGPGSVVNDLSKRDEVFRHFKKYYDKADHTDRRSGDALFPTGVNSTGLLQPDFEVIDAVGRHTAQTQESRFHSRIGEGLLSAPGSGTGATRRGDRVRQRSREAPGEADTGGSEGFTNVFLESALRSDGFHHNSDQGKLNPFLSRSENDVSCTVTRSPRDGGKSGGLEGSLHGSLTSVSRSSREVGGVRGQHSNHSKRSADYGRAKASLEGSSTSAELQVSGVNTILQKISEIRVASRLTLGPLRKPGLAIFARKLYLPGVIFYVSGLDITPPQN